MTPARQYRAGQSIEDHCRSCHEDRTHAVIVVDADGRPLRVSCGFCGSQHNYRGGPWSSATALVSTSHPRPAPVAPDAEGRVQTTATNDLELLLRRVIREEAGWTPVQPAEKWRGGELVLRAGKPGLQDKSWPIDSFFHKIVMVRNRLRTLEQQVNVSDLPDDQKLKLQAYVTACYGSLTSFNVLFADEDDRFAGSSSSE